MSGASGTATIGLQVILNDTAAAGLAALGLSLVGVSKAVSGLNTLLVESGPVLATIGATAVASGALFGIFAGALAYSITQGQGLQDAIVQVENSVQGADQNIQQVTQDIVTMGNTSIFSSQDIATAFAEMGKNGQNWADIEKYTGEQAIILAEALNTNVVPAARLLTTTMQMYNAPASQAVKYTQALTFAFYNGQGSVAGLQDAFNQVAPTAHRLGIDIQDLAIILDIMGQDGLKGAEAGTAVRYMLQGLVSPTQQATVQLANLGIIIVNGPTPALDQLRAKLEAAGGVAAKEAKNYNGTIANLQAIYTWGQKLGAIPLNETFIQWGLQTGLLTDKLYNAQGKFIGVKAAVDLLTTSLNKMTPAEKAVALQQLFSIQGSQAIQLITNNVGQFNDQWQRLTDLLSKTNPATDAARVVGQLSSHLKELGTSIQDAAGVIGIQLIPAITQVVGWVNQLVGDFAKAPGPIHQFAAVFLIVGTVLTGLTLVISAIVLGIVFLASAAGGAALTIGAIMAGLMAAIMLVVGVVILLKSHWQQVQQILAPVGQAFAQIGTVVKSQLLPALAPLLPILKVVGAIIAGVVVVAIVVLIATLAGLINFLAKVLSGAVTFVTGLVQVFMGLAKIVTSIVGGFLAILGDMFHGQWGKIGTDASKMWNGILAGLAQIWNGFKNEFFGIVTALIGGVMGYFQGFGGTLQAFFGSLVGKAATAALNLASHFMEPIKQMPGNMASIGQSIIQGLLNAINNGAGALGNAMRNLAQNMLNNLMSALGIHSPSTVMMEMGGHVATGFLQGITGTKVAGPAAAHLAGVVGATQAALSGSISSAARGAGSAGGAGGNTTLQFQIDSQTVATVVMNNLTRQLQMNGAARKSGNSK